MSSLSQLTDAKLMSFVETALKLEGTDSDAVFARALLRQAIAEAYRATKGYDSSWDNNAVDGVLTITGNSCPLPSDCLVVTRVEWDSNAITLENVSEEFLNTYQNTWRANTGEPDMCVETGWRIVLNRTPVVSPTGKLVIRGYGVPAEEDLLSALPADVQLVPAYYILSEWPFKAENKTAEIRAAKYTTKWIEGKPRMMQAIRERMLKPFEY